MLVFLYQNKSPKLTFKKLSDCPEHLEDEWGYIRNKGVEFRTQVIDSIKNKFYIGFIGKIPVSMFTVLPRDNSFFDFTTKAEYPASELMYVYVDKMYRDLGLGKQIVNQAKNIANASGSSYLFLDTLKPRLTNYYKKQGAEYLGEGSFFGCHTDIMKIKLK